MSPRVSPTDRIRTQIDALFTGDRDLVEVLEDVARLGARLLIQTAVEEEATEFLGRARYQRVAATEDARAGARNGYCPTTIKTTPGRSRSSGRSCAAPPSASPLDCLVPASPRPTRWSRW